MPATVLDGGTPPRRAPPPRAGLTCEGAASAPPGDGRSRTTQARSTGYGPSRPRADQVWTSPSGDRRPVAPGEDAQGSQGVPPARSTVTVLELEPGVTGVRVLERPGAVRSALVA